MPPIIMSREFIARSTKMPRSIGRLSASALSHHGLSSAVFITNIAESDFRYTHRSKMASEACARRRVRKLGAAQAQSSASQSRNSSRRATPMAFTQYAANMARAFMAVELAMASVNCGAPIATRAQAEKLLDEYFALVEQAVPLTEDIPL